MSRSTQRKRNPRNQIKSKENMQPQAERMQHFLSLIHLFGRAIYTIIAWFVLGTGISSTSFFVSLFLFIFPMLMDCIQFGFNGWSRRKIIFIESFICVGWALFSLLGLLGVFVITQKEGIFFVTTASSFIGFVGITAPMLPIQWIWWLLGTIVFITIVDFACRYTVRIEGRNE